MNLNHHHQVLHGLNGRFTPQRPIHASLTHCLTLPTSVSTTVWRLPQAICVTVAPSSLRCFTMHGVGCPLSLPCPSWVPGVRPLIRPPVGPPARSPVRPSVRSSVGAAQAGVPQIQRATT